AEDPVDAPGVEAEGAEASLELGDVVPTQHRRAEVQQPIAEAVARLDQGRPSGRVAHARLVQTPCRLEGSNGRLGRGAVVTGFGAGHRVAGPGEPALEVAHRLAGG